MTAFDVPGLGRVEPYEFSGWFVSELLTVDALAGARCRVVLERYSADPAPAEIHEVLRVFLSSDATALHAAAVPIHDYYLDTVAGGGFVPGDEPSTIAEPDQVWNHVRIGDIASVGRNPNDGQVYVSVECECDWEPEHGLQIVFRGGAVVSKVGPYDGHLTNAAAFARPGLDEVYHRLR